MATGTAIGYRVLHARRKGGGWGAWRDSHLLMPVEVRDPVGPDYPTVKLQFNVPRAADHVWNWRKYLGVDDKVAIVSDHPEFADRKILFYGFVADCHWTFETSENLTVTAVGLPFRMARDADYLVYGRSMLSKLSVRTHYTGLRCSFNADGRPNRRADTTDWAVGGAIVTAHLFTHDYSHAADYWSAVDAMQYLLCVYNGEQTWMTNPTFTEDERNGSCEIKLDVDGMGFWEALARVADQGGYDVCQKLSFDDHGEIVSEILAVRRGAGAEVVLDHQPPAADGSYEVMDAEKTNLFSATVAETTASSLTRPIVAGGRDLYEITVTLGKAWNSASLALPAGERVILPGEENDNSTTEYVKRYVIGGASFHEYADCGRLWDANTDGFFSAAPYSLSVPDVAALAAQTAGCWPVMTYKPLRMLSRLAVTPMAGGVETFLEYTVDGGANWHHLAGGYRVLDDRLGVFLTAANLAQIVTPGGGKVADNLVQKIIDAAGVSLRLTCCIASPVRRCAVAARTPNAGTAFETSELFEREAAGQVRTRAAGSRFAGGAVAADEIDDSAQLDALAIELRDINQDRFIEASLHLEFIDADTPLCARVTRIGGIEVDLATNSGAAVRYPRIVRRTFRLTPETYATEITLDTDRTAAVI